MNDDTISNDNTVDTSTSDSSSSWVMNEEQYNSLSSTMEDIKNNTSTTNEILINTSASSIDYTDNFNAINNTLSSTLDYISSSNESVVNTPEDYYTVMSDLSSQQTFFLSLIFGAIICLLFIFNFRR